MIIYSLSLLPSLPPSLHLHLQRRESFQNDGNYQGVCTWVHDCVGVCGEIDYVQLNVYATQHIV